ncbi:hypothetical protein SLA2020_199570 [Shorea laevis]
MGNLPIKNFNLLRRSFVVTGEHEKVHAAASVMSKATETDSRVEVPGRKKENFWMPDPKTGNFIPERHFGEIDVAELREKKLSKKEEQ